jgi:hypothetical protein
MGKNQDPGSRIRDKHPGSATLDKIALVKFKNSNNLKQNIDETLSKQPKILRKIYTSLSIFLI